MTGPLLADPGTCRGEKRAVRQKERGVRACVCDDVVLLQDGNSCLRPLFMCSCTYCMYILYMVLMIYIQYHKTSQQQLLYLLFANFTLLTYRLIITLAKNKWQKKKIHSRTGCSYVVHCTAA